MRMRMSRPLAKPLATSEPRETTAERWLSIVGIGLDGVDGLSSEARRLISDAELVVGGARHLELTDVLITGARLAWPSPPDGAFPAILARRGRPVVVLATGDPFYFGIGRQIAALVSPREFLCLPQPCAFSLAASRLGWGLQDVACVTLHGRPLMGLLRYLQPGARVLALSWDGTTPGKVAALLTERGFGASVMTVLEAMGSEREKQRNVRADQFSLSDVDPLNVVAIEVAAAGDARVLSRAPGLDDDFFESDGQLTKREVRAVTLSALAPRHGELLWDIGLGAGSIAIEWLLSCPSLSAIGIEARPDRAARALRNAENLGVPSLQVVTGRAPEALLGLPPPDAVFIGGGLRNGEVFDAAWGALIPGGRLVANAVTLESEMELVALSQRFGGELVRLQVSRAEPVGALHGWRSSMPVTQWRVRKP
jgi:precorrin-6B C5,15-methyltransferase / cobalt-precorrin-6B C5,C15-methyltransferase